MPQEDSSSVIVNIPLQDETSSSTTTLASQGSTTANNNTTSISIGGSLSTPSVVGGNDLQRKIQNFQSFQVAGTEKMGGSEGDGFSFFSNQHSVYYLVKVSYLLEKEIVSYTLRRRYTHFKELFDRMVGLKQGQIVYNNETLTFPEKEKWDSLINWKTDEIIKQRSEAFSKIMMEVYDNRNFYLMNEEIFSFFSPSKYTDE
ncbi:hypothetical protein NAEGRDRAFT_79124 [Naegleria gruberi]|uniref:PX domain-containing protein n=1 Tax=Naegleria gruberi TaxID=5762 RepID=D2V963_NAEGR|nr:uncharacterized protein NAEGRDRAFT_79124 [Naegleria gruberi]EFC46655.1 hypothetical protein NAEGRDRAFT_79124 [Naegleria gruberi]|eukprot:XP_002679399.1 hypothetical protein NAEGRDRAFT_79124 [Naegleria gruberi strain NEG-M]